MTINTDIIDNRVQAALIKHAEILAQGGGSGYGGSMDAWQTSVETRLSRIDTDLRHLWWMVIFAGVSCLATIATIYFLLDARIDSIDKALIALEKDQALLIEQSKYAGTKLDTIIERLPIKK